MRVCFTIKNRGFFFLKKKDINELINKTETDLQSSKTNLQLPKGKCGGKE